MARSLNGSSQYLYSPHAAGLSPGNITLSGWFWFDSLGAEAHGLISKRVFGGIGYQPLNNEYQLYIYNAVVYFHTFSAGGQIGGGTLSAGQWYHLAATYGPGAFALYLNGTSVATGTYGQPLLDEDYELRLGEDHYGGFLDGRIADVAIWGEALAAGGIAELYGGGIGRSPRKVRPDLLRAHWRLQEGDQDIDHWGGHTMTPVNSPAYADHPPITGAFNHG